MNDLTEALLNFESARSGWRVSTSLAVAEALAVAVQGEVDWDREAGEDWARVIRDRQEEALVHMRGPLALVRRSVSAPRVSGFPEHSLIHVPDLAEPSLRADPAVLVAVFGARADEGSLATRQFSADDLYVSTV
jgi:hypothetical protein